MLHAREVVCKGGAGMRGCAVRDDALAQGSGACVGCVRRVFVIRVAGHACRAGTSALSSTTSCSEPEAFCPEGSSTATPTPPGWFAVALPSLCVASTLLQLPLCSSLVLVSILHSTFSIKALPAKEGGGN